MLICNYSKEYQSSGVSLASCRSNGGCAEQLLWEYFMNKEQKKKTWHDKEEPGIVIKCNP